MATTLILSKKLTSVKLIKYEIKKVKTLASKNKKEQYKIVHALKEVIDKQTTEKTCRLCLKPGTTGLFDQPENDLVKNIKDILQIEINECDGKPQYVCSICATIIENAVQLKQTAEVTQWRLEQEIEMVEKINIPDKMVVEPPQHTGCFVERDGNIIREWTCRKCKEIFTDLIEFYEHEERDCKKIPILCETCGVELKTAVILRIHRKRFHTGERFACKLCPYRTRSRYDLIVHEDSTHAGTRPFACPSCPATFRNNHGLQTHKKKHLPPSYVCQHCQKRFKFKDSLNIHVANKHTSEKNHICALCDKAYSCSKMLRRHELDTHKRPKMRAGILSQNRQLT